MNLGVVFIFLHLFQIRVESSPIDYLRRFGYINNLVRDSDKKRELESALIRFQDFHGLDKTGKLDADTISLMKQPRCGLPDVESVDDGPAVRFRRPTRNKWNRKFLTYYVGSYPEELALEKEGVHSQISEAFKIWSDVSGITFAESLSYDRADIQIDFTTGNHGDGYNFDGPSGVLAHAFFPGSGGDIHFDDAETWKLRRPRRTNIPYKQLFQIAVHEIGHSLGLQHSKDKRAIMTPVYRGWISNLRLSNDDMREIQRRYGVKKKQVIKDVHKNEVNYDDSRVHFVI